MEPPIADDISNDYNEEEEGTSDTDGLSFFSRVRRRSSAFISDFLRGKSDEVDEFKERKRLIKTRSLSRRRKSIPAYLGDKLSLNFRLLFTKILFPGFGPSTRRSLSIDYDVGEGSGAFVRLKKFRSEEGKSKANKILSNY